MIKRIKDKLQDERGVTILMALFALLVAAMVSLVILNAATTAVHQAKDDQEFEQASLTLQSAAQLIATDLYDSNSNGANSFKIQYRETAETEAGKTTASTSGPSVSAGSSIIANELVSSVSDLIRIPTQDVQGPEFTITASASNDKGLDYQQAVKASYVLRHGNHGSEESNLDYQLIFTFVLQDGSADPQMFYLKMQGDYDVDSRTTTSSDGKKSTTTTTYTYSWNEPRYYTSAEVNQ